MINSFYFLIRPLLEARAEICKKKLLVFWSMYLKTRKNSSEIDWPLGPPTGLQWQVATCFKILFRLHQLFGDISADDIELPEEEKPWQNPLLQQQPDRPKQQNHWFCIVLYLYMYKDILIQMSYFYINRK